MYALAVHQKQVAICFYWKLMTLMTHDTLKAPVSPPPPRLGSRGKINKNSARKHAVNN